LKIFEFFFLNTYIEKMMGAGAAAADKTFDELEPKPEPQKNGSAPQHWLQSRPIFVRPLVQLLVEFLGPASAPAPSIFLGFMIFLWFKNNTVFI
jgi:hypothetical protein